MLVDRYESFKMQDKEKIKDMESRFNSIISEMATLGKKYPAAEMNSKILSSILDDCWETKVTMLKDRDLSKLSTKLLFDSLKSHECDMEMKRLKKGESTPNRAPTENAALLAANPGGQVPNTEKNPTVD